MAREAASPTAAIITVSPRSGAQPGSKQAKTTSTITANQAFGGNSGQSANGGIGIGGLGGTVGGANGTSTPGSLGLNGLIGTGIGGGIFTVAPGMALIIDTFLQGNFASTSNPDVFGVIITVI